VDNLRSRLAERTVVVVGASEGGIGGETAARCAAEGAHVVIGDINLDGAKRLVAALPPGQATALYVDIADETSVHDFMRAAEECYGQISGLVNVVAHSTDGDSILTDIDPSIFDRVMHVNLRGFMLTCRAAIPAMLRGSGGSIVNIASIRGLLGTPRLVAYSCSKAAIIALTRHIATRWGPDNVRANVIAPGLVVTPMLQKQVDSGDMDGTDLHGGILVPRVGRPQDIAATCAFLLSEDAGYITGQVLTVDGGELAHYNRP